MSYKCTIFSVFSVVVALSVNAQTDPSAICISSMTENPELQILKTRFPLTSEVPATLEMLASNAKPNKNEKVALLKLDANLYKCFVEGRDWRQRAYPPALNVASDEYIVSQRAVLADLYAGKIAYGEFIKKRDAVDAKLVSVAREIQNQNAAAQRESARQAQRARDEAEQRQRDYEEQRAAQNRNAAIGMLLQNQNNMAIQQQQNYNNQLQMINNAGRISAPPTVNTNCNPNGTGGFNCTSR